MKAEPADGGMSQFERQKKSINIARGIGIILVVLGHSITKDMADVSLLQYIVRTAVYTVHMPLFFFLSGYLFESRHEAYFNTPAKDYIRARASRFMLPYLSFSALNYGIVLICSFIPGISDIMDSNGYVCGSLRDVILQILTFNGHIDTHLWFCYVMFLVICSNRLFIRNNNLVVLSLLVMLCGIRCLLLSTGHQLPEIINYYMHFMYLFCIGRMWYGYKYSMKSLRKDYKSSERLASDQVSEHSETTGQSSAILILDLASGAVSVISIIMILITDRIGLIAIETVFTFAAEISSCIFILECISAKAEALIDRHAEHVIPETSMSEQKKSAAAWLAEKIGMLGRSEYSFPLYLIHMPFIVSGCVVVFTRIGSPLPLVVLISAAAGIAVSLVIRSAVMRSAAAKSVFFGMKQRVGSGHRDNNKGNKRE